MNEKNQEQRNDSCITARETYWSELTSDIEKIERMRGIVRSQQNELQHLRQEIGNIRSEFSSHIHHDGEIAILKRGNDYYLERGLVGNIRPENLNEVYF